MQASELRGENLQGLWKHNEREVEEENELQWLLRSFSWLQQTLSVRSEQEELTLQTWTIHEQGCVDERTNYDKALRNLGLSYSQVSQATLSFA